MITSAEIRTKLVDALQLDLVGPTPDDGEHAHEVLIQAPSKWYLCGFLAPFGAAIDLKSDETVDEELDQQAGNAASEDAAVPEAAAARKVPFPSSMGLSFLVSEQVTELKATVCWGDYLPIDLEEEETQEEERRKQIGWQRVPQKAELTVPLSATSQPKHIDVPGGSGLTLVIANRPVRSHRFAEGTRSVSVFLVNYRASSMDRDRDTTFAFQTSLSLECTEGFIPRSDPRGGESIDWDEAVASVQYRDEYEFAVGHNVSVIAKSEGKSCTKICTTWIPTAEVARVAPAYIPGIELSMEALASANDAVTLRQMVGPMVTAYESWITKQGKTPLQGHAEQVSQKLLQNADRARQRIAAGLTALDDPDVLDAFRIMNRVIAIARRQQLSQEEGKPAAEFEPPSWRPFQLAFILLNLVSIAEPEHPDREVVDLLFFPTGGGKTEAYLGLAAFALVLRRLRNPGIQAAGVSVLMRYTLRLLTLDQLERASRLICGLELERQQDKRLGTWPFEIGLWVGQSATPNRMGKKGDKNDEYSARARTLAFQRDDRSKPSPIPLEKCPWCGEKFKAASFQLLPDSEAPKDLRVICSNRRCSFRGDNPLPIIAVDEPIYRRLPCFIIATVDKFANLPWVGQTGALFGKVTHHSEKEGFYGPADPTKVGKPLPGHLPPPDLVIQDELHLISGPLGTMVGLYETAIDRLCCIQKNGKAIRPKVIASTATVRRADRQIQALFGRSHVDIFPPPGPDRHDSFFAETISTDKSPGRLYIGVAAQGRSLKVVLLRAYLALLATAYKEWEDAGGAKASPNPADPYMTLLGYFNSLRELGGSRRIIEDEVNSRLIKYGERRLRYGEESSPFANRKIDDEPEELTSRVSTNKVANTKRRLALPFTETERVDVALATNMISVGLDIVRLGLMVVLGQPKTAAEYIQTTSRVGRDSNRPGLVVTLLNVHRPRDRSHYERFQSWHASFYRAVEATSVTPFSPRALDRGLAGVTVALARMSIDEMTPPLGASQVEQNRSALEAVVNTIAHRAEGHNPDLLSDAAETLRQEVRSQVIDLLDTWERISDREKRIQYNKQEVDLAAPLLLDAFDPKADEAPEEQQKFKTQRSLRDVEPTVNVWVRDPAGQEIDGESV